MDYNMPKDLDEIFKVGETQWQVVDYSSEMDMNNAASMTWFVEQVGITEDDCVDIEDTRIIVKHPDHKHRLQIDAGGLGDFFSHAFDVSIAE
ncbi:hypothetical protein KKF82_04275 [Patescibacteria group bacterium]|nr:hypothetical protein [Patescibacteria group bacterium]